MQQLIHNVAYLCTRRNVSQLAPCFIPYQAAPDEGLENISRRNLPRLNGPDGGEGERMMSACVSVYSAKVSIVWHVHVHVPLIRSAAASLLDTRKWKSLGMYLSNLVRIRLISLLSYSFFCSRPKMLVVRIKHNNAQIIGAAIYFLAVNHKHAT